MSIGPSSLAGSISGGQLPAARGSELDKNRDDAAQQVAQSEAAKAAGADGALQENSESSDRDGDGHSYGAPLRSQPKEDEENQSPQSEDARHSLDPSGERGKNLDLSG